jgi:hypothetical protein
MARNDRIALPPLRDIPEQDDRILLPARASESSCPDHTIAPGAWSKDGRGFEAFSRFRS